MKKIDAVFIEGLIAAYNDNLQNYINNYVPNKKVTPITENVFLVKPGDKIYLQLLKDNVRAWCNSKTGSIYIRNDVELTAHLLIHEFIHRLSRNKIRIRIIPKWVLGVGIYIKPYNYNGINEVFTEWITSDITQSEEPLNPYYCAFGIIDKLISDPSCNFPKMLNCFFNSNITEFNHELRNVFYPQINDSDIIFRINQTIYDISNLK